MLHFPGEGRRGWQGTAAPGTGISRGLSLYSSQAYPRALAGSSPELAAMQYHHLAGTGAGTGTRTGTRAGTRTRAALGAPSSEQGTTSTLGAKNTEKKQWFGDFSRECLLEVFLGTFLVFFSLHGMSPFPWHVYWDCWRGVGGSRGVQSQTHTPLHFSNFPSPGYSWSQNPLEL